MEIRSMTSSVEMIERQRVSRGVSQLSGPGELSRTEQAIDNLIAEGGESFFNYIAWIGLIKDPDLIVLSSVHHYYFDKDDLKNINTVINLKQLNLIKYIDVFFHSIFKILPPQSNFIGCFLDNKTQYEYAVNNTSPQYHTKNKVDPFENGITSRIPFLNSVYKLMDSKTDKHLTHRDVSFHLEKQGFKVKDMTDLNGLTYFHSQKPRDYKN